MTELDPIDRELANWQKFCLDQSDAGQPSWYPGEWPMGKVWLPYKTMITEDEALEDIERNKPPNEHTAMQMERWVNTLPPLEKIALRAHYIYWPYTMARAWDMTTEDLNLRRMRRVRREAERMGSARHEIEKIGLDEYHRLVGSAVAELREMMRAAA